jgi:hypothetical protein
LVFFLELPSASAFSLSAELREDVFPHLRIITALPADLMKIPRAQEASLLPVELA